MSPKEKLAFLNMQDSKIQHHCLLLAGLSISCAHLVYCSVPEAAAFLSLLLENEFLGISTLERRCLRIITHLIAT